MGSFYYEIIFLQRVILTRSLHIYKSHYKNPLQRFPANEYINNADAFFRTLGPKLFPAFFSIQTFIDQGEPQIPSPRFLVGVTSIFLTLKLIFSRSHE